MKLSRILAGVAVAGALLVPAAPAFATPNNQSGPACGTWEFAKAIEAYPAALVPGAPSGASINDGGASVTLKKPDVADAVAGVEFVARDLEIDGPTTITVHYDLADGATFAAGAVRLFGYEAQNANTLTATPTYGPAVADANEGTLTLTVGGPLGTLGVVYDASNTNADGTVTFSDLTVGELSSKFAACPPPATTPPATPPASPQATKPPRPVPTGITPSMLPVTGDGGGTNWPALIAFAGVGIVIAGGSLVFFARTRRTTTVRPD